VSRIRHQAYEYWFELLIVALAVAGMLELIFLRSPGAPTSSMWFAVPAAAALLLVLLIHRWFPFGAPAAYWILAGSLSFIDGMLIPAIESLVLVGLASAALLGNLRNAKQAWTGLANVLAGITAVVYNIPSHTTGELILIPVEFGIAWAAGFALRERAEQAEAAEERATHAEFNARIAVAEERGRIARELHDIVAHAVSVMVLQVGVVRRRQLLLRRIAIYSMVSSGPAARPLPRCAFYSLPCAAKGRKPNSCHSRASTASTICSTRSTARAPRRAARRREALPAPQRDRPLCLSHRSGRPDERSQARSCHRSRRDRSLWAGRGRDRSARQRPGQRNQRRPGSRAHRRP
jgi:hypothetical protein